MLNYRRHQQWSMHLGVDRQLAIDRIGEGSYSLSYLMIFCILRH